jgi:tetratricopeptide (TPR) repeat protein
MSNPANPPPLDPTTVPHDVETQPEPHLAALGPRFLRGLALRNAGRVDEALSIFNQILTVEPRLPEPRLERGRIRLEMGQLEDAEADVREAIRVLESGGQWSEDVPENVVLALAWSLLGEIIKEKASTDDVVFGDEETFRGLIAQSRVAFARAAELDPTDNNSQINALELSEEAEDKAEMTGDFLMDLFPNESPIPAPPPAKGDPTDDDDDSGGYSEG